MAHYAFLNDENIVTEVITGIDETELIEGLKPETWYGNFKGQTCKRTSYNNRIRGNYAGIGSSYLEELDIFMPPKCHDEALLNEESAKWNCENIAHEKPENVETQSNSIS
jgi:hypothetical protein